ncbi:hypothetical protein [Deminuibacter soli]|uniref:hypothetical protein n=1 Tax=Deminuibacter soli TaxID=2291815 RepID=UPI0011C1A83B|nr:hypothetical protein [Deminuibacter soli]
MCKVADVHTISRMDELVLDTAGCLYRRTKFVALEYNDMLGGFSMRNFLFGLCYVHKTFERAQQLSIEDLHGYFGKMQHMQRNSPAVIDADLQQSFFQLTDPQEALKWLFYIADSRQFPHPEKNEFKWRQGKRYLRRICSEAMNAYPF